MNEQNSISSQQNANLAHSLHRNQLHATHEQELLLEGKITEITAECRDFQIDLEYLIKNRELHPIDVKIKQLLNVYDDKHFVENNKISNDTRTQIQELQKSKKSKIG